MFWTTYDVVPLVEDEKEKEQVLTTEFFIKNCERIKFRNAVTGGYANYGFPSDYKLGKTRMNFRGLYEGKT